MDSSRSSIAVVTGASAGIGRATAREFAARGCDVAIIARNTARLEATADELRENGVRALPLVADVADADAIEAAAERIEAQLGPIGVWVNNAMATIFAPFDRVSPEEFRRGTEVTYLGQVHGTMAALSRMRRRDQGTIVNVGSALAYRAIPLQSVYCGAKYAVRGFTDSLRTELMHDRCPVRLVMVHLPAVNTPQFDWALNKTGRRPQPVPPIFQPEVPARAIVDAALYPRRREVWVGMPTWQAIIANKIAPGLVDRYLAKAGYSGQLTDEALPIDAPANLFQSPAGDWGAHGRFDDGAYPVSIEALMARHRGKIALGLIGGCIGLAALCHRLCRR
ncbi:MAG TPA: SDR family oxidoreductase [Stellaceae bacterium]|jgi:short-subunit dehydrogenase|nr:SDR family oxidoreductase [Stellaceae bacterium]